jgi:hypothetical protein
LGRRSSKALLINERCGPTDWGVGFAQDIGHFPNCLIQWQRQRLSRHEGVKSGNQTWYYPIPFATTLLPLAPPAVYSAFWRKALGPKSAIAAVGPLCCPSSLLSVARSLGGSETHGSLSVVLVTDE